jgi:PAS fold
MHMSSKGTSPDLSRTEIASLTLREFIANSPAAFIMFDQNLCQIEASPRWRADFGGIAAGLRAGQHFYESYPDLPTHLRAAHRRALAGEVTRAPQDRFAVKGQEVFCAWEVRPWGDVRRNTGGIIVYAEHLNRTQPLMPAPCAPEARTRKEPPASRPIFAPSNLMARGIEWSREGSDALQRLLSGYREISCSCDLDTFPLPIHRADCPAHPTVPLIVRAERAIRRLCALEELLRKDWTLIN